MRVARWLWGSEAARPTVLFAAGALALLVMLGASPLWTMEGRWAVICSEMMRSGDYLHPYLLDEPYYDKPLPSYWLMIGFARVLGDLNEWALRLPGALAGLLALGCTVRLGRRLFDRPTGLLAGWILATCFFFVLWSRQACADMLNLAAVVGAVTWYFERKDRAGFVSYAVFFLILAVGSLMKGPIAATLAALVLVPDLLSAGNWRRHLRPSFFAAALVFPVVFAAPFLLSSAGDAAGYPDSGLKLVFRENVVRFFFPFDHVDPLHTYLLYGPLYLLPWTIFLPAAIWRAARRWRERTSPARWTAWACAIIFVFLSASGSRRPYYLLPILPFAALFIAEWVRGRPEASPRREGLAGWLAVGSWGLIVAWFGIAVPYNAQWGGYRLMAEQIRARAETRAPWGEWRIALYNAPPSLAFYCRTDSRPREFDPGRGEEALRAYVREHPRTVLVARVKYQDALRRVFDAPALIREQPRIPPFALDIHRWFRDRFVQTDVTDEDDVIALIP